MLLVRIRLHRHRTHCGGRIGVQCDLDLERRIPVVGIKGHRGQTLRVRSEAGVDVVTAQCRFTVRQQGDNDIGRRCLGQRDGVELVAGLRDQRAALGLRDQHAARVVVAHVDDEVFRCHGAVGLALTAVGAGDAVHNRLKGAVFRRAIVSRRNVDHKHLVPIRAVKGQRAGSCIKAPCQRGVHGGNGQLRRSQRQMNRDHLSRVGLLGERDAVAVAHGITLDHHGGCAGLANQETRHVVVDHAHLHVGHAELVEGSVGTRHRMADHGGALAFGGTVADGAHPHLLRAAPRIGARRGSRIESQHQSLGEIDAVDRDFDAAPAQCGVLCAGLRGRHRHVDQGLIRWWQHVHGNGVPLGGSTGAVFDQQELARRLLTDADGACGASRHVELDALGEDAVVSRVQAGDAVVDEAAGAFGVCRNNGAGDIAAHLDHVVAQAADECGHHG